MTLREVLHAHIPTLTAGSSIREAVDKMDIYQFPALVIVGSDMEPLGVITEGDVARAVGMRGDLTSLSNEPAIVYGSKDPQTASPEMEIGDALHKMLSSGLTILPVVETSRLNGVVLRVDLMQAMLMDAHNSSE